MKMKNLRRLTVALLMAALPLCMAAQKKAQGQAQQKKAAQHYTVQGQIDGLDSNHHATINMTGKQKHHVATHDDGTFMINAVEPGSYTVRPVLAGYRFTPTFHTIAVRDHDHTGVAFTAHRVQATKKR